MSSFYLLSSGDRIRTYDLWVMSPTSYLCSTPQYIFMLKELSLFEAAKIKLFFFLQLLNTHFFFEILGLIQNPLKISLCLK